jgi:hypothetical protein
MIKKECVRLHKIHGVGVCLTNKIHSLFHKIYKYGGSTEEQFNEFVDNYYNDKYKDLELID